jgi:guanylate kinase
MANAALEMKQAGMFKHQIVNDDLESAVEDLAGVINKESGHLIPETCL